MTLASDTQTLGTEAPVQDTLNAASGRSLRQIVYTRLRRDKVAMVSRSINRTHDQVVDTTEFVNQKIVVPAREIAAIMAGVKKGLEVLFAPAPKQIDRVYTEEELFIG